LEEVLQNAAASAYHVRAKIFLCNYYDRHRGETAACRGLLESIGGIFEATGGDIKLDQQFCVGVDGWAAEFEHATLGRNGKQYVNKNYRWSHVLRKYERLFARLAGPGADASPRPQQPDRDRGDRGDRDRDGNRDRSQRDSGNRGGRDRNRGRYPRRSR